MKLSDVLNMAAESADLEARRLALVQQVESIIASADELARTLDGQDGPAVEDGRTEVSPYVILSREDGKVVLGDVTVEIFTPSASGTPRDLSGRAVVSFYRGAIATAEEVLDDEHELWSTVGGERVGQISSFYHETTHNDSMERTLEYQPEEPFDRKIAMENDVRVAEARANAIKTSLGVISTAAGDVTLNPRVS